MAAPKIVKTQSDGQAQWAVFDELKTATRQMNISMSTQIKESYIKSTSRIHTFDLTMKFEYRDLRGRPSRRWQDDITEKEGTTWIRKATDRRRWKTLMEGYILQWMDKA